MVTEMIKCKCGCGGEIIKFDPTTEEAMRDRLQKEYFAAIRDLYDPSVIAFVSNLFSKGAKQSRLDRARDLLVAFEDKYGQK